MPKSRKKKQSPKRVLALPDLEQSKTAVLNSLTSRSGQRSYDHAIADFGQWYCSEPRLAFKRTVVPIPDLSRTETVRADNDQSAPGSRSARRLRGRRFRTAQSRTGSRNPTRQRGSAGLESVSGTGSRRSRASDCWRPPRAIHCVAKGTTRSSPCGSDAGFAAASCSAFTSNPFKSARSTG